MMRTLGIARNRRALAVLLFAIVAGLPGCVIYATAAPENSAVAAAPPPVEPEAEKTSGTTRIDGELVERETVDRERLERERAEKERVEKERVEKERVEKERAEKQRVEKERADKERAEKERVAKERADRERAEKERAEKERVAKERIEKERAERVDKERVAKERAEKERAEKERTDKERTEKERVEKERVEKERADKERANKQPPPTEQVAEENHSPRSLEGVPPGHYPRKAGECRLWLADTPPGRQPRAVSCPELMEKVPDGAFILYAGKAWDSAYDWPGHAEREQVADEDRVPDIIVQIVTSLQTARAAATKGTQQD